MGLLLNEKLRGRCFCKFVFITDCVECMACSDNVVRAGLTPKFKDVPVLCDMLIYNCKEAEENKFPSQPHKDDPCVSIFNPPVPDFAVQQIKVCFFTFVCFLINTSLSAHTSCYLLTK